jgi:hypothetical protein
LLVRLADDDCSAGAYYRHVAYRERERERERELTTGRERESARLLERERELTTGTYYRHVALYI